MNAIVTVVQCVHRQRNERGEGKSTEKRNGIGARWKKGGVFGA